MGLKQNKGRRIWQAEIKSSGFLGTKMSCEREAACQPLGRAGGRRGSKSTSSCYISVAAVSPQVNKQLQLSVRSSTFAIRNF